MEQGTVLSARDEWDKAYYGKTVTPTEILFGKGAANPGAEPLRQAVAALASPNQTSGMR